MLTEINTAVVTGDIAVDSEARAHIRSCTDRIVDGDDCGGNRRAEFLVAVVVFNSWDGPNLVTGCLHRGHASWPTLCRL
jgi:hypothetical protein